MLGSVNCSLQAAVLILAVMVSAAEGQLVCTSFSDPTVDVPGSASNPKRIWVSPVEAEAVRSLSQFCKEKQGCEHKRAFASSDDTCDVDSFATWSPGLQKWVERFRSPRPGNPNDCFESISCCKDPSSQREVSDCKKVCELATCTCPDREPDYEGDYNGNCVDVATGECHQVYVQCLRRCETDC